MIEVQHDAFTVKTDNSVPGTYRIFRTGGKGSMPLTLMGRYTSLGLAKADIDRYRARNSGGLDASKTRTTGRGK